MPAYESINLHPADHLPSSLKTTRFDVICIGSGWAGRTAAARVVKAGLTAVIVENELVGGDCPYWACVPSKALLRPEVALDDAKAVSGVKERVDASKGLDVGSVFARRDMYTAGWDDNRILIPFVESSGVVIVRGTGTLIGNKKVAVNSQNGEKVELVANHAVVVSTGSEPIVLDIPGLADANPWGPRQATSSNTVPEHLIIFGAGAVGCELAIIYASLGSKISIICSNNEILPKFDPEAGELVRKNMEKFGLMVHRSVKATSVRKELTGEVTVSLSDGTSVTGTQILIAVGRKPKTTKVGFEIFGVPSDGTPVEVDESLCIKSLPGDWLYAVGDINGRAPLTHFCKYQGRIAANAIVARAKGRSMSQEEWSQTSATADRLALSQVVFTIPEVASVGHTRTSAQAANIKFRVVTAPVATVGANIHFEGYEPGWAQWVVEEGSNKLIGATICGHDCAELIHGSTVGIVGGLTLEQMGHAIPSFPTMSEVYQNLIDASGI